jgi:hypothetical protein
MASSSTPSEETHHKMSKKIA